MRTVTVTDSERPMVFKFFLDDEEVPRFLGVEFWPRDDEPAQHIPEKERTRLLRNAMFVLSTLGQTLELQASLSRWDLRTGKRLGAW